MSGAGTQSLPSGLEKGKGMNTISTLVTPARVAALVAYVVTVAYPGIDANLRGAIVGAVTGLYILCVAIIEVAERKHGPPPSSQVRASAPRTPVKEIR